MLKLRLGRHTHNLLKTICKSTPVYRNGRRLELLVGQGWLIGCVAPFGDDLLGPRGALSGVIGSHLRFGLRLFSSSLGVFQFVNSG
jgi:hypothetical protein